MRVGSKKEMIRWSKQSAGGCESAEGEVVVEKVKNIDQEVVVDNKIHQAVVMKPGGFKDNKILHQVVMNRDAGRHHVYGGGGRTRRDGVQVPKQADIERMAEEFINKQRSRWSNR